MGKQKWQSGGTAKWRNGGAAYPPPRYARNQTLIVSHEPHAAGEQPPGYAAALEPTGWSAAAAEQNPAETSLAAEKQLLQARLAEIEEHEARAAAGGADVE